MKATNLTAKVEFLKGEVEQADDKAKGQGIQVEFKVFCQLMLQLYPNFDIGTLKALVTVEVVEEAIIEVKVEVITACEVAPKAMGTNSKGLKAKAEMPIGVLKVVKIKDVDRSQNSRKIFFFFFVHDNRAR